MSVVKEFSVEKEFEKNPKISANDIKVFRQWLNNQPHLPSDSITDLDLVLAYHCCEYSSEVSKQVLDLNFTLRTMFLFYQNRELNKNIKAAFQNWLLTPLRTPTLNGYRVIYCQLLDGDPKKFIYVEVVRAFTMMIDFWQHEEGTAPGVALIVNMDKISLAHLSRVDLIVAQQFFYFLQEAMFVKLKEFHFINAPTFMDKMLMMFRPFMKKELLDILQIHQIGSNTLEAYMPLSGLPKDVGGNEKDALTLKDELWSKIEANKQFFIDENKKRVNESLRPGKPKTLNNIFSGIEGTFKKLDID